MYMAHDCHDYSVKGGNRQLPRHKFDKTWMQFSKLIYSLIWFAISTVQSKMLGWKYRI